MGTQIITEPLWGNAQLGLLAGGAYAGSALVGPGSDLTLVNGAAAANPALAAGDAARAPALQEQAKQWARADLPEPEGYWEDPDHYWDDFDTSEREELQGIASRPQGSADGCASAVELKLAAEAYRGSTENNRQQARLRAYRDSSGWTPEQVAARQEALRQGIAATREELNALRGRLEENEEDFEAAKAMGTLLRQRGVLQWEIDDLEDYRLPVLRGDCGAVKWDEKELYPYKRDVQRRVYEMAKAGLPMPDGYRFDPSRFWGDYRYEAMKNALDEIQNEPDPCEAALRFKFFMEANQGQWTSKNWGGKTADLATDVALIWLPPNAFDALQTLFKDVLLATTPVGQAAVGAAKVLSATKNAMQTVDRLMKEVVISAAGKRAQRTHRMIVESRGWNPQEVQHRMQELSQQVGRVEEETRALALQYSQDKIRLEAELDALDPARNGGFVRPEMSPAGSITELRRALVDAENDFRQGLRDNAERILELQTYSAALENYRMPVAEGGCEKLWPGERTGPPPPSWCAGTQSVELILKEGIVRISKAEGGAAGEFSAKLVISLADELGAFNSFRLEPDGTEFSVEKHGESATLRVFDGTVTVSSSDGLLLKATAGQQVRLPDGVTTDFDVTADDGGLVAGLPLRNVPLDSAVPEPYGTYTLASQAGGLSAGWVWQDVDPNHTGAQDATLEVPDADVVRVTVPNGNEFGGHLSEAPRLLHKVTGDFDLESEMLLECEGRNYASNSFVIFTPGVPLGYLYGNMNAEGLPAQYYTGRRWPHHVAGSQQAVHCESKVGAGARCTGRPGSRPDVAPWRCAQDLLEHRWRRYLEARQPHSVACAGDAVGRVGIQAHGPRRAG